MEIITKLKESHQKDSNSSHQFTSNHNEFHPISTNHSDWGEEIGLLCSRFCKIIYRTKQLLLARAMQAIVGGLGFFAFSLSFLLSSTVEALPIYLQERRVIMKEISTNSYKISSYLIANTVVFLPFLLLVSLLFSIPVYWIVGLNPSPISFSFFLLVVWLIVLMASSLVLFLSAISPDFISGNSFICTVLGAFFLFSGYFTPKQSIANYWMFMYPGSCSPPPQPSSLCSPSSPNLSLRLASSSSSSASLRNFLPSCSLLTMLFGFSGEGQATAIMRRTRDRWRIPDFSMSKSSLRRPECL